MLSADREEFDKLLSTLCAGWDKPVTEARSAAYWMGLGKMPLIDFGRVVEHCVGDKAPAKFPTVHDCWDFSRTLKPVRALGALATREAENWDPWLVRANLHLLAYIRKHVAAKTRRYGDYDVKPKSTQAIPHQSMHERVACLVEAKNLWALDMRESASSRDDPAYQKRLWDELFVNAEARIDAMIAGELDLTLLASQTNLADDPPRTGDNRG